MNIERRISKDASMLLLFCVGAIFSLSSCSEQSGTVETRPSPTPAEAKMEGQSGNWKVKVGSISKVPKEPLQYDPMVDPVRPNEGPVNKYDTLRVGVVIEYTGPAGDIQSPAASLINDKGEKFEGLKVAFHPAPDDVISMKNVPPEKVSEVIESPEYKNRQSEIGEILNWIDPDTRDYKKKPRALKSGEKLDLSYSFKDPKEYSNLKLVFNDVPPIPLKAPSEEKERK